jgi:predicted metal-dependent peptidase
MLHRKPTAEQRIQKAIVAIMANPRYMALSGVMMVGAREVTDDPTVPTACTNGRDERYNRAFVDGLRDAELRFLILHEVYHKMYRHLHTWRWMYDEDPQTANVACDMVINTQLVDENSDGFATMTGPLKGGCYDTKYRGWDSARVYRDLRKNGGGSGGGSGTFDAHDWEGAAAMGSEEVRELAQHLDEALRQGSIAAGKLGSGGDRDFSDLLQPEKDWREVLRDFVQTTCSGSDYSTWQRPNRRYVGMGMYMPSGISERIGEIVVAPDMSGSIGGAEVQRMLSELASIATTVKPEAVRILYWDTKVCGDERYEQHELDTMIQSTKPKGGGGTAVECLPAHMAKHQIKAQCTIVFTDGYLGGSWGNWTCPVLWVIVDNKSCRPPFGTVVHVSSGSF